MLEIKKKLELTKLEYYKTHLSLVNCILPVKMTPKEIEVMASFMILEGDIALSRFGPTAKALIRDKLGLSPSGMSNYMTSLLRKEFLLQQGDNITILPLLFPEAIEQRYMFRLVNLGGEIEDYIIHRRDEEIEIIQ